MTGKTRRRLIVCAVLAVLALPVEAVLMAAMRMPDANAAAREWATGLVPNDLQDAALHIQDYPYHYRRAIMTALEPEERAQVWRRLLAVYGTSHPDLGPAARAVLERAISAMTPDVFDDNPPADRLAELSSVFEVSVTLLGRRTATDLFMRLGPDDGSSNVLPVAQQITDVVREWVTLYARSADCECTTQFSTSCDVSDAAGDTCSDAAGCEPDVSWPMCGVAWSFPCNGLCTAITRQPF